MANKKCVNCGHSVNEHDFSHKSECRSENCNCDEFIFETRKCDYRLCDKVVDRTDISELMLNPQIQLIPRCKKHFRYLKKW